MRNQVILGLSAFFHSSSAAVIRGNKVLAAAEEERFTRVKFDPRCPTNALRVCLETAGLHLDNIARAAYYENPEARLARICAASATGFDDWGNLLVNWSRRTAPVETLSTELHLPVPVETIGHHESHAALAYGVSGETHAAVLVVDAVGETDCTTMWQATPDGLKRLRSVAFPQSLGLFYSAITEFLGFRINSDEYKVMGLAAFGRPRFQYAIMSLIRTDPKWGYSIDSDFFELRHRIGTPAIAELFGVPARLSGTAIEQVHADIAASAQAALEECMLSLCRHIKDCTGAEALCLAGGVALNCVSNARIAEEARFDRVFVPPAPDDAGASLGAAIALALRERAGWRPRRLESAALGPAYPLAQTERLATALGFRYERHDCDAALDHVADALSEGRIVGWFEGRMEFGARALGHRSILADPREAAMKDEINARIKKREPFRPFAPVCRSDDAARYFADIDIPFMTFTTKVTDPQELRAVTHVDGSARLQTVTKSSHPLLARLLERFAERTGVGVLLNTSMNVADQPIACTPADALDTFREAQLDLLVFEGTLLIWRNRQDADVIEPGARAVQEVARVRRPFESSTYFFS